MSELPHKKGNRKGLKRDSLPHNIGNPNTMRLPVTKQSKKEYINEMRPRYRAAGKKEQTKLLEVFGIVSNPLSDLDRLSF